MSRELVVFQQQLNYAGQQLHEVKDENAREMLGSILQVGDGIARMLSFVPRETIETPGFQAAAKDTVLGLRQTVQCLVGVGAENTFILLQQVRTKITAESPQYLALSAIFNGRCAIVPQVLIPLENCDQIISTNTNYNNFNTNKEPQMPLLIEPAPSVYTQSDPIQNNTAASTTYTGEQISEMIAEFQQTHKLVSEHAECRYQAEKALHTWKAVSMGLLVVCGMGSLFGSAVAGVACGAAFGIGNFIGLQVYASQNNI